MKAYLEDGSKPAPRLPNVEEEHFKMTVEKIGMNLWNLLGRKLWGTLQEIEHIIVFDNTTRDISVLYNSDVDTTMESMLLAIEKIKQVQRIRRCHMRS